MAVVQTNTGQLAVTGFAPDVQANVLPGVGQLTLDGFAPDVQANVIAGFGALTLTGLAPQVFTTPIALPDVGQLMINGFAPWVAGVALTQPAWAFTFDGHVFYVLPEVDGKTLVYDMTTGQWHLWYTGAVLAMWNMRRGRMWKGRAIAADETLNKIWEVDPHSELDEGSIDITRVVSGFQPVRGTASARQGSLRVTANVGEPNLVGATVQMRFSDNEGQTWSPVYVRILFTGDFDQPLRFRSLGRLRAPGRIWEITDTGGLMFIEGADGDIEGEEDQ